MKTDTKQRILAEARSLFNRKGYNGVSMQDIADAAGISKGNLTYHFKKKEHIMEALVGQTSRRGELETPETLAELDTMFHHIQQVVKENSFYFQHHAQLSQISPGIFEKQNRIYKESIELFQKAFQNLNRKGLIRDQIVPGEYETIIDTLHMASIYWESFMKLQGSKTEYHDYAWKLMYHLLTPRGIMEMQQIL